MHNERVMEKNAMKITIINGQNHRGSTQMVARKLAEKVGGEITEFFLPRDFDEPCLGCYSCFQADMTRCPTTKSCGPSPRPWTRRM